MAGSLRRWIALGSALGQANGTWPPARSIEVNYLDGGVSRRQRRTHPYETRAGIWVRSKGEAAIANHLHDRGIRFWYERRVAVRNARGNSTWRSCDFVLDRGFWRSKLLWEHFGMWGDAAYQRRAKQKLAMYHQAGRAVVVTFGHAPSPSTMDRKLAPFVAQLKRRS